MGEPIVAVTCRNVRHLHDAYLDGELSASMAAEVQAHLLQCPECQRQMELLRACGEVIARDQGEPAPPADLTSRVMTDFVRMAPISLGPILTRRQRRERLVRRFAAGFLPAAAAMLAVSVLVLPPSGRRAVSPDAPRVVAGQAQYRPVEVLGVRDAVVPTLHSLARGGQAADELRGVYEIAVGQVAAPASAQATPRPPAPFSGAFLMELLHPFTNMMTPPPATTGPDAPDVVRF